MARIAVWSLFPLFDKKTTNFDCAPAESKYKLRLVLFCSHKGLCFRMTDPTPLVAHLTAAMLLPRGVVYALISAVVYIPAFSFVSLVLGYDVAGPGIYLPMLAIDG